MTLRCKSGPIIRKVVVASKLMSGSCNVEVALCQLPKSLKSVTQCYSSAWRSCLPLGLERKKVQPFASRLQIPWLCQLHSSHILVQILPRLQD